MTEDEIRETKFAWVAKGYSPLAVNGWLADAATCLDAGVPPAKAMPPPRFGRWLRGYDITAVDQLVSALGFDPVAPLDRPPRSAQRASTRRTATLSGVGSPAAWDGAFATDGDAGAATGT